MSDAPERITLRVDPLGRLDWPSHGNLDDAEVRYIRADLVPDPAAIRAEALEEAARVADRAETEFWEDWKEGADPHDQGKSDGATEVAARLRALIEQPAEGGEDG